MSLDANNVRVGVTGAVYTAPTGSAVPTTATGTIGVAFTDVGYISEDGVTTSTSTDTNDITAWQNGDIVRKVQTSHDFTVSFTMIETKAKSLEVYYGNYTHGPGGDSGVSTVEGVQGYRGAWVLNVIDDDDIIRITIPDGQVTERGDVSYVNGDAVAYEVTITCYPDVNGVKASVLFETEGAS